MTDHHHHHAPSSDRGLISAVVINLTLTIAQVIGGVISGSLSLIADALHNLSDAASLGIALFARKISRRPADEDKSFGYQRAETVAALINLTLLVVISLYLIYCCWYSFGRRYDYCSHHLQDVKTQHEHESSFFA